MAAVQTKAKAATKKAKVAVEPATTRKSSRISEQQQQSAAKRKAAEDGSPSAHKKRKPEVGKAAVKAADKTADKTADKAVEKKAKASKKTQKEEVVEEAQEATEEVAEEQDETTKALVAELDDADEDGEAGGGASLFTPGQDVGKAPVGKKAGEKAGEKRGKGGKDGKSGAVDSSSPGGVVYIGRIPHGFFEHEMRSYFSQFGDIRRLRLSRNRRTGASKHYAFIEFADRDVAAIVAQTMDNYLLFGHILRCTVVSPERVPPHLFAGANRRFKAVPWNRIAGRQLAEPKSTADWSAKNGREAKRRAKRAELLQAKLGYTYTAPGLKALEAPQEVKALEDKENSGEVAKAEKETTAVVETETTAGAEAEAEAEAAAETQSTPAKATKAKKGKGRKSKA